MALKTALLFGCALCGIHAANASPTPMWPTDCANVSTGFSVPSTGGSYEAIGCKFPNPFVNITFPEVLPVGTVASVVVSNGWVGPGNTTGMGLVGPSFDAASLMGPLQIAVTNMTFSQDAVIRFTGALPPSSSLTISGNTFSNTRENANAGSGYLATAMSLGNSFLPLSLSSGSRLEVSSNVFIAQVSISYSSINILFGNITVAESSIFNVSLNAMRNSSTTTVDSTVTPTFSVLNWNVAAYNPNATFPYLTMYACPLMVANGSTVAMNGNSMSNSALVSYVTFQSAFLSVINLAFGSGFSVISNALALTNASSFSITGNFIVNSTCTGSKYGYSYTTSVVSWSLYTIGYLTVDDRSSLHVDGNMLGNSSTFDYGYVINWQFWQMNGVGILNSSRLSFQNNSLSSTMAGCGNNGCSGTVVYVSLGISWGTSTDGAFEGALVSNWSSVVLSGNSISSVVAGESSLQVVKWVFYSQFVISCGSTMEVNSNWMANTSVSGNLYLVNVMSDASTLVVSESSIEMINNVLNGSTTSFTGVATWLLYSTNVTMLGRSTFITNNNSVQNSVVNSQCYVAQVQFYARAYNLISDGSFLTIDGNFIVNSTVTSSVYVSQLQMEQSVDMEPGQVIVTNATISLSRNWVSASTFGNGINMCFWDFQYFPVNILNFAKVIFDANSVQDVTANTGTIFILSLEVQVIIIDTNATFIVQRSLVARTTAEQVIVVATAATTVAPSGLLTVVKNFVDVNAGTPSSLVNVNGLLTVQGKIIVSENMIVAPGPITWYMLINANTFTSTPGAEVLACNNSVSWDTSCYNYPAQYLRPSSLADMATLCVPANPATNNDDSPSHSGVIAGAVVGSAAGVALLTGVAIFIRRRGVNGGGEPLMEASTKYGGVQ